MNYLRSFIRTMTAPVRFLFRWPVRLIGAPRRLMGMSFPARVAVLLAVFLLICTITAYIIFFCSRDRSDWHLWLSPTRILIIVVLLVAIPFVVYQALRLWLQGDISRFPDIDKAWKAGLAELDRRGLDISGLPIFLIIGAPDERSARSLLQASALDFVVADAPQGPAPLHWYADENAIYLASVGAGCLSRLNRLAGTGGGQPAAAAAGPQPPAVSMRGTLVAGGGGGPSESGPVRDSHPEDADQPMTGAAALRGTLVPGSAAGGEAPRYAAQGVAPTTGSKILSRGEAEEQTDRLTYLCELLRNTRQPLCPLNGVLTLLPFEVVQNVMTARELPGTVKTDVSTIRDTSKLHCPVTALVTNMEHEGGFSELVRRVGIARAKTHRFGKGFDVWVAPTPENIDALSSHACGAFEDWVYSLFREEQGLNKPGNSKLYTLLCKIRSHVHTRLRNILVHAYSYEASDKEAGSEPMLFSGCYFAATGDAEDRQAFVRNVFEKVVSLEEDLEWTDEAITEDRRFHRLTQWGMILNGLLVAALIGMLIYYRLGSG